MTKKIISKKKIVFIFNYDPSSKFIKVISSMCMSCLSSSLAAGLSLANFTPCVSASMLQSIHQIHLLK